MEHNKSFEPSLDVFHSNSTILPQGDYGSLEQFFEAIA